MAKQSILDKVGSLFSGRKTYLLAVAGILYGLTGAILGHLTWAEAINLIQVNILALTLRAGISGVPEKVAEEIE